jgi:hypothetical protein
MRPRLGCLHQYRVGEVVDFCVCRHAEAGAVPPSIDAGDAMNRRINLVCYCVEEAI